MTVIQRYYIFQQTEDCDVHDYWGSPCPFSFLGFGQKSLKPPLSGKNIDDGLLIVDRCNSGFEQISSQPGLIGIALCKYCPASWFTDVYLSSSFPGPEDAKDE